MSQDLPDKVQIPSAWYGPNEDPKSWTIDLSLTEIAELEAAYDRNTKEQISAHLLSKENFSLPTLGPKLEKIRSELIHGKGFVVIRRIPVENYTEQKAGTIFYGIGLHLGSARSQNSMGHLLGHVRDLGLSSTNPNVRIYQTKERQTFHTDSSDAVGLLCLKTAKAGGISLLVSASTIFNEIQSRRPDLLKLLFEPIATDRRGEIPEGMLPFLLIPVFSYYQSNLTVFYQRQYIESAQRFPEAPRLTPQHIEALDLFDSLANDPKLNLSMKLEPGDIQFVYNHALLHDRTAFEDWADPSMKRHLLRLWISLPGDRELPEVFSTRFGSTEVGNRGGIICKGTVPSFSWTSELK